MGLPPPKLTSHGLPRGHCMPKTGDVARAKRQQGENPRRARRRSCQAVFSVGNTDAINANALAGGPRPLYPFYAVLGCRGRGGRAAV
jgi:hypothetical protein